MFRSGYIGGFIMALFGSGVSKEEKKAQKEQEEMKKFMNKYQLDDISERVAEKGLNNIITRNYRSF